MMPEIKKGETLKEWIPRCVAYLMKKEGKTKDQALGQCYGMWRQKHPNADDSEWLEYLNNGKEYEMFTCDATFSFVEQDTEENSCGCEENTESKKEELVYGMVAIVGDRFMNGGFFSNELLKRVYKEWEGTLHDINHMGTTRNPTTDRRSDITYFVGYHKNVKYDEATKSVSVDVVIEPKTRFANAWLGYIELCKKAGITPNVSVTYYGRRKFVKASELPVSEEYLASEGYTKDDYVPYLDEIRPVCILSFLEGRCNDRQGCGIRNTCSCEAEEEKRKELIERIKKLEESLYGRQTN